MARLLSNGTGNSRTRRILGRRAKSLESVVVADSEPPTPRCPSPTPSSGVDSNKDSPIQIENIDGSSIGTYAYGFLLITWFSSYYVVFFFLLKQNVILQLFCCPFDDYSHCFVFLHLSNCVILTFVNRFAYRFETSICHNITFK